MVKSTICSKVITYPQYGPTCWFNAIIMAVLYSQYSRKLILKSSERWQKGILIFDMIKTILKTKFIKGKDYDVNFGNFNLFKPENILKSLHKHDPTTFMFDIDDPKWKNGFLSELYIKKLYQLLGISKTVFFEIHDNNIYYSNYNDVSKVQISDNGNIEPFVWGADQYKVNIAIKDPEVILLMDGPQGATFPDHYKITNDNNVKELLSTNSKITYNNNTYILDSIMLSNWNKKIIKMGHAIAGITCNNERYVYNGWTKSTLDPALLKNNADPSNVSVNPCELMKFGWSPKMDFNFCLNPRTCSLDRILNQDFASKFNLCFSFKKPVRLFIYIKETAITEEKKPIKVGNCNEGYEMSIIKGNCVKKCNEFQVRSPTSNRCIKTCPINKDRSIKSNNCIKVKCENGYEVSPISGN